MDGCELKGNGGGLRTRGRGQGLDEDSGSAAVTSMYVFKMVVHSKFNISCC